MTEEENLEFVPEEEEKEEEDPSRIVGFRCAECGKGFMFEDYDLDSRALNKANIHINAKHERKGEIIEITG